jgi:NAD(P)-dependent dehydrogenase (short-subunit alcohol dehydrogenase family)
MSEMARLAIIAGYHARGWAVVDRFGRTDTLVNNAGLFTSKPFTDCTAGDYALITGSAWSSRTPARRRCRPR